MFFLGLFLWEWAVITYGQLSSSLFGFLYLSHFPDFDMSDAQQEHALAVERLAPRLAALRIELCPSHMSEGCFWKIYFVLLHPRLSKHDAELLSTPQVCYLAQSCSLWPFYLITRHQYAFWYIELQRKCPGKMTSSDVSLAQILGLDA